MLCLRNLTWISQNPQPNTQTDVWNTLCDNNVNIELTSTLLCAFSADNNLSPVQWMFCICGFSGLNVCVFKSLNNFEIFCILKIYGRMECLKISSNIFSTQCKILTPNTDNTSRTQIRLLNTDTDPILGYLI